MKNFTSSLSVVTTWTDENKKTIENKMKIKGQTIQFRTTFRVETKEVLDKLLQMKRGYVLMFKKEEAKLLNNALLKIEREQCHNRLSEYSFLVYSKGLKKGKVMVVRERD
jgi:hypothetical protein